MSFDGIFINAFMHELKEKCIGARVDKIHQPESDELTIQLRGFNENLNLFISVESSMPYFTLSHFKKENPQTPPMFCMLMRKHLSGGRIVDVTQRGFERVVTFAIEAKNELSEIEKKYLIIEIMGKHSNVILTREDYTIIDSIKRITPDLSRVRTVLPGLKFEYLPTTKQPLTQEMEDVSELDPTLPLYKALYQIYEGFSPQTSEYLLRKAQIPTDLTLGEMSTQQKSQLSYAFNHLKQKLGLPSPSGYVFLNAKGKNTFTFLEDYMPSEPLHRFDSLSALLDFYFGKMNQTLKMHQRTLNLKKTLQTRIERIDSKIKKIKMELSEADGAETYKIKGELLLAHLYATEKGQNKVEVYNYYLDPPEPMWIDLDIRLEPSANAQAFFKKYNKLKTASVTLIQQLEEAQNELDYLEQTLTLLDTSEDHKTVEEIRSELASQGIIKYRNIKKTKTKPSTDYRQFRSSDGYDILVGKNNHQNDTLTLKLASNKDIWLHTKIIPGSHVIIRTQGDTPPDNTIEEAAIIAAYYSKARLSSNVPVDYTIVKNVSKPSGAKPGMVIYVKNKTLFVTPDETVVQKLSI